MDRLGSISILKDEPDNLSSKSIHMSNRLSSAVKKNRNFVNMGRAENLRGRN